jgi:2'-5' RNA ligase
MSDAIRAFVAIDLDAEARRAAAEWLSQLRAGPDVSAVRWVRPEALHVTLRFLGNVAAGQVEAIARAVGAEVSRIAPFELALGPPKLFPSARRPRVVALELEPEVPLAELAAAVERGVVAEGFEPEARRFRAHLTLGRIPGGRAPALPAAARAQQTRFRVGEAVLFRSDLSPSGSRYTPLERMPLGGTVHP